MARTLTLSGGFNRLAVTLSLLGLIVGPHSPASARINGYVQSDAGKPDVIVKGHRLKHGLPEHLDIDPQMARGRAKHQQRAETFAKCMRFFDLDLLHKAIDGPPHQSSTAFAIGRIIQKNFGCYPDQEVVPPREAGDLGGCNAATVYGMVDQIGNVTECRAPYDRAAILRRVMAKYGGDLNLTVQQTNDPAVQARFNAREVERNRLRRGDDKLLFEITVCMVRMAPKDSLALIKTHDTETEYWLDDNIVSEARPCIGGAKDLGIDPAELRDYITDSAYRWIVAARNVDSLIPQPG